ncbi:uncharacterized protein [Hetaerina americana]|uniref:uncharacterized protein n=1 Tax=Hetaerina americana TaxID=62018 RepID=UPI003A7F3D8F
MEKDASEGKLTPQIMTCITDSARGMGLHGHIQLDIKLGTSDGDNYLGVVYSVKVTGQSGVDGDGDSREARFVLKMMHPDPVARKSLQSVNLFANEIKLYSRIIPAFRDFQIRRRGREAEDLLAFVPRCFAAEGDGASDFILMEDLKASGFLMGDRRKGMDRDESTLAMRALGRLHAFSYAMKEEEPDAFGALSEGIVHAFFVPEKREMYHESFQKIGHTALEAVRIHSPGSAKYLERWISKGYVDGLTEICQMKEPLSVINHGDVWMNNVLFRGTPAREIMLLDYQLIQYHSPAIDVLYVLYSSLKKSIRDEIYEDLLMEYHKALSSTLRELGVRDDILSMETLKDHFKKYAGYGLGLCLFLIPIFYGEVTEEIVNVGHGDSVSKMACNHSVYMKSEEIQLMIADLVDEFVQRGYFEE